MSHHRFFRHVQRKPDVSVEVWHENQSSTDTCSQLLFSLLSGTADIWGNALCQVLQELATIRNDLADRIVKEIEWILLHAVLDRLEPQLRVSSRVGLSSVLEISEIASSSSTLVCSCAVRHSLSSRLLLKVDFVQRENFAGLLGRDFHPAYLCRNPPIRPCNQPFEAWLALVCAFDVLLPAEVALDLLHLKLCAVDIIFSISWALGLPSRAASLSLALSTAFAFANGFSIWKGTKGSHLQRQPVFKWSRRAFSSTKKWRNFFWGGPSICISPGWMDLAAHEVGLQTCPCIGVWARREGFSSRSILVLVLLHLCVVAHSGDLVRSVDPGELTIHRVIRADDVLVGDPVRTDDCFIGPEQATAALNNELGIKGNIVLLSGSRSRKLFPSNWVIPRVRRNEKVVRPPSPLRPATWDQPVLDDLLHCQAVTTVVNHPWERRQHSGTRSGLKFVLGNLAVSRSSFVKVGSRVKTCFTSEEILAFSTTARLWTVNG